MIQYTLNTSGPFLSKPKLTADDLIEASSDTVSYAVSAIESALKKAGMQPDQLDLIIMAGGSSNLPGVRREIKALTGLEPKTIPHRSMYAVAYGASLFEKEIAMLPRGEGFKKILGDDLGLLVSEDGRGKKAQLLISHDTKLPVSITRRYELNPGQRDVSIQLAKMTSNTSYQPLLERNIRLQQGAKGIAVKISINENKVIQLTAYDPDRQDYQLSAEINQVKLTDKKANQIRNELELEVSDCSSGALQPYVGIDLGTTTCEVSVLLRGAGFEPELIKNDEAIAGLDEFAFPSVVSFASGTGNKEVASRQAYKDMQSPSRQEDVAYNFKTNEDWNEPCIKTGGKEYTPRDLSAILLNRLWETLKKEKPGTDFRRAVITVPAGFNSDQWTEVENAARSAGISDPVLLDEPTAAFLYYKSLNDLSKQNIRYVLVFDFGGGTVDVSILDVQSGTSGSGKNNSFYSLVAEHGIPDCGGKSVDQKLYKKVEDQLLKTFGPVGAKTKLNMARNEIETAKVALSNQLADLEEEEDW